MARVQIPRLCNVSARRHRRSVGAVLARFAAVAPNLDGSGLRRRNFGQCRSDDLFGHHAHIQYRAGKKRSADVIGNAVRVIR